jgi:hypothetical protein
VVPKKCKIAPHAEDLKDDVFHTPKEAVLGSDLMSLVCMFITGSDFHALICTCSTMLSILKSDLCMQRVHFYIETLSEYMFFHSINPNGIKFIHMPAISNIMDMLENRILNHVSLTLTTLGMVEECQRRAPRLVTSSLTFNVKLHASHAPEMRIYLNSECNKFTTKGRFTGLIVNAHPKTHLTIQLIASDVGTLEVTANGASIRKLVLNYSILQRLIINGTPNFGDLVINGSQLLEFTLPSPTTEVGACVISYNGFCCPGTPRAIFGNAWKTLKVYYPTTKNKFPGGLLVDTHAKESFYDFGDLHLGYQFTRGKPLQMAILLKMRISEPIYVEVPSKVQVIRLLNFNWLESECKLGRKPAAFVRSLFINFKDLVYVDMSIERHGHREFFRFCRGVIPYIIPITVRSDSATVGIYIEEF